MQKILRISSPIAHLPKYIQNRYSENIKKDPLQFFRDKFYDKLKKYTFLHKTSLFMIHPDGCVSN